jgi:hypothetical protein
MQLASGTHIPDGLLAANSLLAENSRQGFGTWSGTVHQGFGFVISHTSLGIKGSLYDGRIRSRSTGKERDTESGLDYFGARYYASSMGRSGLWTAAGPNCSTEVWKILQKFKLAKAGLLERPGARPKLLWNALVRQWNPSQIGVKPANGKDYGHPRFDMFELLWQSLPQSHEQVTHKIDYNPPPETPQNQ